MSLPIVIIFERHWDEAPKYLVKELLPELVKEGYDTLCLEGAGQDLSASKIIKRLNHSIESDKKICSITKDFFKNARVKISGKLSDIAFEKLADLIQLYVSTKAFINYAERIKGLPASLLLKDILEDTQRFSILVKGIDIDSKEYNRMLSGDSLERSLSIDQNEDYRIKTIVDNLLRLHDEGKGIIFSIGALHSDNLISKFKQHGMEDELICYFPHSPRCSNDKEDNISFSILEEKQALKKIMHEVPKKKIGSFVKRVIHEIKDKKMCYKAEAIDANSHSVFLSTFFKNQFQTFKRANYHVDALLEIDQNTEIENIKEKLQQVNIQTRQVFFQKHRYLVISGVNTTEVAENIRKLH
ncbi:MAG: hypothetical protein ACRCU0_06065 [Candidatus Rhabdochlamydia sp.]